MPTSQPEKRFRQNHHPAMRTFCVVAVVLWVVPLIVMVVWAFNSLWSWPSVIPDSWTLRGFESLLRPSTDILGIIGSSMLIAFFVCGIGVVIATMAGQALANYDFPGKNIFDFMVFLPAIVPAVVFGIGASVLFIMLGINNTYLGVIIIQMISGAPFAVKMMTNASRMLGNAYVEQAVVLGSSRLRAFFQVSLKPLVPTMISAACMIFTVSIGDYFLTFLIGGGLVKTFGTVFVPMVGGSDTNMIAAYAVVYVAISFIVFIALDFIGRRILKGQESYLM